jgi:hypothetical protein
LAISSNINDGPSVAAAVLGNVIFAVGPESVETGETIDLDWPCERGITLSAFTIGGCLAISYF